MHELGEQCLLEAHRLSIGEMFCLPREQLIRMLVAEQVCVSACLLLNKHGFSMLVEQRAAHPHACCSPGVALAQGFV